MAQRTALVTGGNRGIGKAVCRRLAREGYYVLMGSRDLNTGIALAAELSEHGEVDPVRLDITNPTSIQSLVDSHYEIDVLVNNAGIMLKGRPLTEMPEAELTSTFDVNVLGPWRMCKALLPGMRERGYGRIVNVSSQMGQLSNMTGDNGAYRISKTALNSLTRILDAETASDTIKINSVCPGWVRTDMGGKNAPREVEEGAESIVWAATLGPDGPSGGFYQDGDELDW
jgi:NAD(P)-dependent dehydrogenase (short-subunit alcohol dehydrogenase family)